MERTGKGIYTHANGDMYIGEFLDGDQNGHGKFTWVNGSVYDGQWKNNNAKAEVSTPGLTEMCTTGSGKTIWLMASESW